MDSLDFIMAFESGEELTCGEVFAGVQKLIDNGVVWKLQGSWGRLAKNLIEAGHCTEGS
jgi:hypothetical protein